MRAVIMAAGDGTRWGDYLGVPKHLAPIDGVPILARLVDQFERAGCDVVTLTPDDERYVACGGDARRPRFVGCDTDKFMSTLEWWVHDDLTTVVYGDTFLTERAVDALLAGPGWVGRAGGSSVTGCGCGEMFGVSVVPETHGKVAAAILGVRQMLLTGAAVRGGGWEVHRATQGPGMHGPATVGDDFTHVDDWSDDFDYPGDYDRWMVRWLSRGVQGVSIV